MTSKKLVKKYKWTVADFFCGAGGFSEGFNQAGFNVVFSLDNWKPAVDTHDINHPNCDCRHMNILDIDTIDDIIPDTDIIVGSPPCVSFSNSNNSGKADKTLGKQLIHQFLKIVLHKKSKPNSKLKYWIMENVPNSIDYIKDKYTAEELGLDPKLPDLEIPIKHILTASDYGSPQGRKRAIVGDYIIPEKTHIGTEIKVKDICEMLGPPLNNVKETISDILFNIVVSKNELTDHFYDTTIPIELWSKAKRLKVDHGFMGKMQFPDSLDRISRTIMATESYCSREAIIFPMENCHDVYRAPTIREIASLMGFPINYQFKGNHNVKHKQIGNAVCVQLSHALGKAMYLANGITIKKIQQRKIVKLPCEQVNSLFNDYLEKPKRPNSKYARHIPYLKLNQLRVELDNSNSPLKDTKSIETMNMVWKCYIHKGSGSNALKNELSNTVLVDYLDNSIIEGLNIELEMAFNGKLYDSNLFQIKNCRIPDERDHLSPDEVLDIIKSLMDETIVDIEPIKIDVLFDKELNMHSKIAYGLYCVNYVVDLLSKNNL
jgi:DNA (cytosine-5)-methyltransferase 1